MSFRQQEVSAVPTDSHQDDQLQREQYSEKQRPDSHQPLPKISRDNQTSLQLTHAALEAAINQKGLDVRGIHIARMSDVADYFVIVSGTSERHVKGIADKVEQALAKFHEKPNSVQGYEKGEWVLLDYGNIVIHVFYEPTRQYYSFDELWRQAQEVELSPQLKEEMRNLRTGTIRIK